MGTAVQKEKTTELKIPLIEHRSIKVDVIGVAPLIMHRMAAKAKQQLLLGGRKKTQAERKQGLKHDPPAEFVDSMEQADGDNVPTRLLMPATAFKAAMAEAAIETPGLKKTQIQRLTYLPEDFIHIWGVPALRMDIVRSADINHTPDVRTRGILDEWCASLEIGYATPALTAQGVKALVSNAGIIIGVGDFRQGKGRGRFGRFKVVRTKADREEFEAIRATGGRVEQDAAIENPRTYDPETKELLNEWADRAAELADAEIAA